MRAEGPLMYVFGNQLTVGAPGGESTITAIDAPWLWSVESPLPGGRLVIDHKLQALEDGLVTVSKRYEVHGPLTWVFRLYYAPQVRKGIVQTFRALEREAALRAG